MEIIEKLKFIKQTKKITNEELSERAGVPLGTLNKLLSGSVAEPKLSTLLSLCRALGCRLADLTDEADEGAESDLLAKFRALDAHGRDLAALVIEKEYERCHPARPAVITRPVGTRRAMLLPLYDLPVSAGSGSYLDGDASEDIRVELSAHTQEADYALRISGDSMMPRFSNGDVILVNSHVRPEEGELGVFVCDGEGYFKKFGGDRLISLNPAYRDIPLAGFTDVACRGRVLGRLR